MQSGIIIAHKMLLEKRSRLIIKYERDMRGCGLSLIFYCTNRAIALSTLNNKESLLLLQKICPIMMK
jgi:hypothetical protein